MIPVAEQWAKIIDVTDRCPRRCSNCTRPSVAHCREHWDIDLDTFRAAVKSVATFPAESPPCKHMRTKVVGIIGGEPQLHPQFADLCAIIGAAVPGKEHRGLWTGIWPPRPQYAEIIEQTFGVKNLNTHDQAALERYHAREIRHQPVLVAIQDIIPDKAEMWRLINACNLQVVWCSSITPKGCFFCEVAGALDMLFGGPGGLPIEDGWWRRPLADFQDQINRWCPRCGIALPWRQGRKDSDLIDDVSESNLSALCALDSPRVGDGRVNLVTRETYLALHQPDRPSVPTRYLLP